MFTARIRTENQATKEQEHVAELINDIASKIKDGHTESSIYDYNGNRVGKWSLEIEPDEEE